MGDPKFTRKQFSTPSHPWEGVRISEENQIIHKYGLKNKRELWKTQTMLRDIRQQARELQARQRTQDEQALKEVDQLLGRLKRLGLLTGKADLNDVLALEVESVLSRRLQTQIYLKGLARTVKQARQLIVHGHIAIDGRKVTVPSYMVKDGESGLIDYYHSSPMISDLHPERPAADFKPDMTTVKEERRVAGEKERDMRRSRELERIERMRQAIRDDLAEEEEGDEDEDIDAVTSDDEADDGKGKDQPKEGPKGKDQPKEGPKGKDQPKEGPKGKDQPKEGPKGKDQPKEGPKGKDQPKKDKGGEE